MGCLKHALAFKAHFSRKEIECLLLTWSVECLLLQLYLSNPLSSFFFFLQLSKFSTTRLLSLSELSKLWVKTVSLHQISGMRVLIKQTITYKFTFFVSKQSSNFVSSLMFLGSFTQMLETCGLTEILSSLIQQSQQWELSGVWKSATSGRLQVLYSNLFLGDFCSSSLFR